MSKQNLFKLACTAIVALLCASYASAYDVSKYATQSKLATGKWVKITIPENGIYELTYDELRAMGFSSPSNVRLYGYGGYRISEILNGNSVDDLTPVPVKRTNNKMVFYGKGSINFTIAGYNSTPHYVREFNPYSQVGCYFLTEESTTETQVQLKGVITVTDYTDEPTNFNYFYYENELVSVANSGKEMMGENFTNSRVLIDYYLPGLADSTVTITQVVGAKDSYKSYAEAILHSGGSSDTTSFLTNLSSISSVTSTSNALYNTASPYGKLKLSHPNEHGQFEPYLRFSSSDHALSLAYLDHFIISYNRLNVLSADDGNQLWMSYAYPRGKMRYMLPNATATTLVWYLNNPDVPTQVTLNQYNDESGKGYYFFSGANRYAYFVAFDPAKRLKKISSYEEVPNQNLHGMPTPELLIITDKAYHEQAERVAQLHRTVDGIEVAVVDQDQIFNEFSSGTRDAMAYRLFCKMLYDRDPSKLKNLLLFGTGSIDNRGIMGEHEGFLLTYQSDNSNNDLKTYTSDDFFTYLADGSGSNMSSEKMTIGVGRITCGSIEEARSDVDKLVEYYATPDYGVWRNNTLIITDSPDAGQYVYQGEGYREQIDNELSTGMHVNTVHNSQYPRSNEQPNVTYERKLANVAKQQLKQNFKSGMYFATYAGHAGTTGFTRYNQMWVTSDVASTSYKHLPIMSTSCCDVARFDGDSRGVAELMFHKRDGGAIALLTTGRQVLALNNDVLNRYFIEGLFSHAANGVMPTLGDAYKYSKNAFSASEENKMKFFLLGDPAMRINYPVTRFNITRVNNTNMTNAQNKAQISPLMKFDIEARVLDEQGNLDNSFNGDATVTLYDKQELYANEAVGANNPAREMYFNREKLAEVSGRVVNGVFTGQMVAPKEPIAVNEDVLLRVYAHKDNTDYMVNGFTKQITMLPYNEAAAVTDNQAPVVTNMFINDETTFAGGTVISPEAVLYITATDNEAINIQTSSVSNIMSLSLDGGRPSYDDVISYVTTSDGAKVINIEYPLSHLSEGMHTLTFTVCDVVGNSSSRTISFMVGQGDKATLTADKLPAYSNEEVTFDLETSLAMTPEMTVRVTNATGELVWMTTTSTFPVTWDMRDMNGNRVPGGLYRYFGTYNNGTNYGGTPINKLIVLDPVKTPLKYSTLPK
jgi:hypothetical protein